MKILYVNSLYSPNTVGGGAERSVQYLAESMAKNGHVVKVVSLSPVSGSTTRLINSVECTYLRTPNIYFPFAQPWIAKFLKPLWHLCDSENPIARRAIRRIIEEFQPDIFHTNNLLGFSTGVWREARKLGIPVVHTIRDYYLLCPRSTMFNASGNCNSICASCSMLGKIRQKATKDVTAVIGVSASILEKHRQFGVFVDHKYMRSIPNGYRNERSKISGEGSRRSKLIFGYLGRISPEKGLDSFVKILGMSGISAVLKIGGKISESKKAKLSLSAADIDIEYVGFVRPYELLEKIDFLIVPSLWDEPFSRAIVEAYAHGVPVIASKRGGITELVAEGKTGFLFDPQDDESVRSAIYKATEDSLNFDEMRKNCLAQAEKFLPESVTEQYFDLYRNLRSMKTGISDVMPDKAI
ncbi:glycosyltransferase family 4 protein [Paraburkholderia sp. GAS32]|jgi:glycogen(starch) synthase|uniref:glycosyltransferase family 4 protein n=1 Tax=Paraburkholderia sp. GAS32 TaxID=3035129 RepID=UPI003D24E4D2